MFSTIQSVSLVDQYLGLLQVLFRRRMTAVGLILAGMMVPLVIDYFSPAVQNIRRDIPGAPVATLAPPEVQYCRCTGVAFAT